MKSNVLTIGADMGNDAFKIISPNKRELFIMNILAPWHERRIVNEDTRFPLNLLEVEVKSKNQNLGKFIACHSQPEMKAAKIFEAIALDIEDLLSGNNQIG